MTREEFVQARSHCRKAVVRAEGEIARLEALYIRDCSPFQPEERVGLRGHLFTAEVIAVRVDADGAFTYRVRDELGQTHWREPEQLRTLK